MRRALTGAALWRRLSRKPGTDTLDESVGHRDRTRGRLRSAGTDRDDRRATLDGSTFSAVREVFDEEGGLYRPAIDIDTHGHDMRQKRC